MATKDSAGEDKTYAEKAFPNPRDVLDLMVSFQRLGQQMIWQMGEVMSDVMSMPLKRDGSDETKSNPMNKAINDMKAAVDSATETLQTGSGKAG
jgi:hypothetical protein